MIYFLLSILLLRYSLGPIRTSSKSKKRMFLQSFHYPLWNYNDLTDQNDLQTENPEPRKGRLTARPSGKFCMPMPIARFLIKKKETINRVTKHSLSLLFKFWFSNNATVKILANVMFNAKKSYLAFSNVADEVFPMAPKPTPTANPSKSKLMKN